MRLRSLVFFAVLLTVSAALGQTSYQTLPQGFDAVVGNSSSNFPQNTTSDQIWHWHYAASEFDATGPILITDIAIRPKPNQLINSWNFLEWKVTLIEAATAYGANDANFGMNVMRSMV